ncbi:MAG: hypothetical protein PHQ53_00800 [Candidatus Krumholzibacteria bacterium]|nr:hypothetical protein [Candidatus Krumholzibacteria bacterium]
MITDTALRYNNARGTSESVALQVGRKLDPDHASATALGFFRHRVIIWIIN